MKKVIVLLLLLLFSCKTAQVVDRSNQLQNKTTIDTVLESETVTEWIKNGTIQKRETITKKIIQNERKKTEQSETIKTDDKSWTDYFPLLIIICTIIVIGILFRFKILKL